VSWSSSLVSISRLYQHRSAPIAGLFCAFASLTHPGQRPPQTERRGNSVTLVVIISRLRYLHCAYRLSQPISPERGAERMRRQQPAAPAAPVLTALALAALLLAGCGG